MKMSIVVYVQVWSLLKPQLKCCAAKHGHKQQFLDAVSGPLHKLCDRLRGTDTFQRAMKGKHIKCNIYTDNCRGTVDFFSSNVNTIWKPILSFFLFICFFVVVVACHTIHSCLYVFYFIIIASFFSVDECLVNWICRINLLFK